MIVMVMMTVFGSRLTEPDACTWQEKKAKTRTALPASDGQRSKPVSPPDATGADKKTPQPPPCSPATPSETGARATPQQPPSSLSPSEEGQRVRIDPDSGVLRTHKLSFSLSLFFYLSTPICLPLSSPPPTDAEIKLFTTAATQLPHSVGRRAAVEN